MPFIFFVALLGGSGFCGMTGGGIWGVQALGKLLVIWGVLIPAIAFPWMRDFDPASGLLGSVRWMFADVAGTRIVFHHVLSAGLGMVGLGLSLLAARRSRRSTPIPTPTNTRAFL